MEASIFPSLSGIEKKNIRYHLCNLTIEDILNLLDNTSLDESVETESVIPEIIVLSVSGGNPMMRKIEISVEETNLEVNALIFDGTEKFCPATKEDTRKLKYLKEMVQRNPETKRYTIPVKFIKG